MKLSVLPVVLTALGLAAQISARPVRIYVLAPEHTNVSQSVEGASTPATDAPVAHMRWGLAAAEAPQSIPQPMIKIVGGRYYHDGDKNVIPVRMHRCGGALRSKASAVKNWFREKVGMAPVPTPHHLHFPHGRPMPHRPENVDRLNIMPLPVHENFEPAEHEGHPGRYHHFHHHHAHHRHARPSSFTGRVQRALMTLGPWEGRLVAFVIGCGIGSLLRMFYVLCVLTYRSFQTPKEEEDVEVIFEVSPPTYFDDVKVAPSEKDLT